MRRVIARLMFYYLKRFAFLLAAALLEAGLWSINYVYAAATCPSRLSSGAGSDTFNYVRSNRVAALISEFVHLKRDTVMGMAERIRDFLRKCQTVDSSLEFSEHSSFGQVRFDLTMDEHSSGRVLIQVPREGVPIVLFSLGGDWIELTAANAPW